ncbi:ATP12 family chaperone protein [Dongia deserti]|uniref:ATP12 family chaperone protein n=1 Tax=Dongia deserti TaxID=2268030 RepID=UPI000E647B83|nr:ATP12 family protein [Dongia deserti]
MLSAPRRFYKSATVTPVEGGWSILLDSRPLRSPAKRPFVVPTGTLAAAIAEEWQAQGEQIVPRSMPLMQFAATAIDRLADDRGALIEETAGYGRSDVVCYRAHEPASLVRRQEELWQPLIAWVAERYDIALNVTAGIVAVEQPPHTLATFRRVLEACDLFALTALAAATSAAGSLVIALALAEDRLSAEEAADAALLDELFQAEKWGSDPEAERRREAIRADLAAAKRFHALSRR